jgi:hypothetical protein
VPLAEALLNAEPKYATAANAQASIRDEFKDNNSPPPLPIRSMWSKQIFGDGGHLPCTLLVVDEIQQFIGDKRSSVPTTCRKSPSTSAPI